MVLRFDVIAVSVCADKWATEILCEYFQAPYEQCIQVRLRAEGVGLGQIRVEWSFLCHIRRAYPRKDRPLDDNRRQFHALHQHGRGVVANSGQATSRLPTSLATPKCTHIGPR